MVRMQRPESKFLKHEDVQVNEILRIISEPVLKDSFGTQKYEINVKLRNGDVKILTLNNTTQALLMDTFGDDTNDWTNKDIRVISKNEQNVRGTMRTVLMFDGVKEQ